MFKRFLLTILSVILLSGCSSLGGDGYSSYPLDNEGKRRLKRGALSGEGGLKLFGGGTSQNGAGYGNGLGVNSFLWRATLDTISFMPLSSVDPHGGVIITDWYEDPKSKGERFKLNILILGKALRVDGLKVSTFKQRLEAGNWRDSATTATVSRELEDKILTRARELRINNAKQ